MKVANSQRTAAHDGDAAQQHEPNSERDRSRPNRVSDTAGKGGICGGLKGKHCANSDNSQRYADKGAPHDI